MKLFILSLISKDQQTLLLSVTARVRSLQEVCAVSFRQWSKLPSMKSILFMPVFHSKATGSDGVRKHKMCLSCNLQMYFRVLNLVRLSEELTEAAFLTTFFFMSVSSFVHLRNGTMFCNSAHRTCVRNLFRSKTCFRNHRFILCVQVRACGVNVCTAENGLPPRLSKPVASFLEPTSWHPSNDRKVSDD